MKFYILNALFFHIKVKSILKTLSPNRLNDLY